MIASRQLKGRNIRIPGYVPLGKQDTPASSLWLQEEVILALHSSNLISNPEQDTPCNRIGPLPWPNKADPKGTASARNNKE